MSTTFFEREKNTGLLSRIVVNPAVCHDKPCVRGHRVWVTLILDFLASGAGIEEILESYPALEREDILACIAYGAETSRRHFVDLEEISNAV